jgi:hypothetical protein
MTPGVMIIAGLLDVDWEIQGQNDVGGAIERENWLEASKPLTHAERLQEFIISSKILDVSPRNGQLRPGQSSTLEFTVRSAPSFPHAARCSLCLGLRRVHPGKVFGAMIGLQCHTFSPVPFHCHHHHIIEVVLS